MFHPDFTYESIFRVFFTFNLFFTFSNAIQIKTKQGILDGIELTSRNETKFHAFFGIPYAKPPVGDLRFQPPQPADSWEGVRDAAEAPPRCIQRELLAAVGDEIIISGQEDCLYLNVFTPESIKSPLPVMVYIHGGGFFEGEGYLYGPNYLLDHQIILVTLNYRLGALGYLSAGDDILPGNAGMKDQVAALKWVQKYINDFGGDPQQVTIFGESAGGASVHFHMFSPLTKGLFQRAISQSGTALAEWARLTPAMAYRRFLTFGILAGCRPVPTQVALDCLKKVPADELVRITQKFYVWDREPLLIFSVVVEPENAKDAFLPKDPWNKNTPILHQVPWIIGLNSGEGVIMAGRYLANRGKLAEELDASFNRYTSLIFTYVHYLEPKDVEKTSEKLKSYYFKNQKVGLETETGLVDLITDSYFAYDILEAIHRHPQKPYVYYFDHRGEVTIADLVGDGQCCKNIGPSHGDDVLQLFFLGLIPPSSSPEDQVVSERMVKYWINFAYTGKPISDDSWKPTQSPELDYWHIETKSDSMKTGLLLDRFKFWKNLQAHPLDVFSNG